VAASWFVSSDWAQLNGWIGGFLTDGADITDTRKSLGSAVKYTTVDVGQTYCVS